MHRAPWLATFALGMLLAGPALAGRSAHLVYVRDPSAASCPDETVLREAVRRRVGYDPFFAWAKNVVVVEIAGDAGVFVAHVRSVDEHGLSDGVRDLRSDTRGCQGLVDATALAISIALDMDAFPEPRASASAEPPVARAPSSEDAQASAAPAHEVTASPPPASESPAPPRDAEASPPRDGLHGIAGVDVLASAGTTPAVVPGLDAWVGVRRGHALLALEASAGAPDGSAFANGGRANVVYLAGTLAPCVSRGLFFACALGSVGWLEATGSDVQSPKSGSAIAVAAGARAGLEVPLGPSLSIRVRGDFSAHVLRPAISLNGAVWQLPALGGVLALGAAYRFL